MKRKPADKPLTAEQRHARLLMEECEAEFVRDVCAYAPCGREFKPNSRQANPSRFCSPECASASYNARVALRAAAAAARL